VPVPGPADDVRGHLAGRTAANDKLHTDAVAARDRLAAEAAVARDKVRDAQLLAVIEQKTADYTRMLVRVESLEARVESLHEEHAECERIQGELRGEIAQLRAQQEKR
jgi:hypothetical protein